MFMQEYCRHIQLQSVLSWILYERLWILNGCLWILNGCAQILNGRVCILTGQDKINVHIILRSTEEAVRGCYYSLGL